MTRLEESDALGRRIRQDNIADLVVPTWDLVRQNIQAGEADKALELLDHTYWEGELMHDMMVSFVSDALTHLAQFGEEELPKMFRRRFSDRVKKWLTDTPGVEESVQRFTEYWRGHFGNTVIEEERDRYVAMGKPCGSGGRLMENPEIGRTKKAYPWSWSKVGVPYYCTHCCFCWEIIPTELRGYPLRIDLPPEKAGDPCVHLFYKKPELIPEEYFTCIGMNKTIK